MNRKKNYGSEFVETSRALKRVGVYLIAIRSVGKYIITAVDYFSRYVCCEIIENKKSSTIIGIFKNWCRDGFIPETLVSDNGKEFVRKEFKEFCISMGIKHDKVGIEFHRANDRVERVIGTIRESIEKFKEMKLEEK
ncbi:hypothetical protein CDIK_3158 [Cucumispora dikerogammari]|nr:hypothetical protein CDIK_3158 [Cucumispora dikerogammari]